MNSINYYFCVGFFFVFLRIDKVGGGGVFTYCVTWQQAGINHRLITALVDYVGMFSALLQQCEHHLFHQNQCFHLKKKRSQNINLKHDMYSSFMQKRHNIQEYLHTYYGCVWIHVLDCTLTTGSINIRTWFLFCTMSTIGKQCSE